MTERRRHRVDAEPHRRACWLGRLHRRPTAAREYGCLQELCRVAAGGRDQEYARTCADMRRFGNFALVLEDQGDAYEGEVAALEG
jgi:hypothetical protein